MTTAIERRNGDDRRVRRVSFHYPERRSGFDRRAPDSSVRRRVLAALRDRPVLVGACLAGIGALSALDVLLTWRLIALGGSEANPVMARMFDAGLGPAVLLKAAVTTAVCGGIWLLRRYRQVLEFSLVVLALLTALVAYQVFGLAIAA